MSVLRLKDTGIEAVSSVFRPFGLQLEKVNEQVDIPGSHWGDEEAGLIANTLYVRSDTPIHSALHEGCHWLLMDKQRRAKLHTNAGGTMMEENAVCYLQIILASRVPGMNKQRMFSDMDEWGYSFRLGAARLWFEKDAEDARLFLESHPLVKSDAFKRLALGLTPRP